MLNIFRSDLAEFAIHNPDQVVAVSHILRLDDEGLITYLKQCEYMQKLGKLSAYIQSHATTSWVKQFGAAFLHEKTTNRAKAEQLKSIAADLGVDFEAKLEFDNATGNIRQTSNDKSLWTIVESRRVYVLLKKMYAEYCELLK